MQGPTLSAVVPTFSAVVPTLSAVVPTLPAVVPYYTDKTIFPLPFTVNGDSFSW